jgi:hypothetical protein
MVVLNEFSVIDICSALTAQSTLTCYLRAAAFAIHP